MNKIKTKPEIVVVLDNIRSVYNVGGIFRTADAALVCKIYLCGITPTPIDRFGRHRQDLHKSALGAEKSVDWQYKESTLNCITELQKQGYTAIAIEQAAESINWYEMALPSKIAFVLGNEVQGVNEQVQQACDAIAEIPMLGIKKSLNVMTTAGVVLLGARHRR